MNNLHVRRNAPHVLTLESAQYVRRVTSEHNVIKHAQVVAMVGVHLTRGRVLLVGVDHNYGSHCKDQCSHVCSNFSCHQNGTCFQCSVTNVYGFNCNIQCSSLCVNATCDRWTGKCPLKCNSLCEQCDSSTGLCTKCPLNKLYGNICEYPCNTGCLNQSCNHTTGECISCTTGYWGPFCNNTCNSGCSLGKCDRDTGTCFECANKTSYGDLCNTTCSHYCSNGQCEQNGKCSFGCETNHFSAMCKTKCSAICNITTSSLCDDLGQCLEKCVQSYTGEDCKTGMCLNFDVSCLSRQTVLRY